MVDFITMTANLHKINFLNVYDIAEISSILKQSNSGNFPILHTHGYFNILLVPYQYVLNISDPVMLKYCNFALK